MYHPQIEPNDIFELEYYLVQPQHVLRFGLREKFGGALSKIKILMTSGEFHLRYHSL
jgi:hypothetical protein